MKSSIVWNISFDLLCVNEGGTEVRREYQLCCSIGSTQHRQESLSQPISRRAPKYEASKLFTAIQ